MSREKLFTMRATAEELEKYSRLAGRLGFPTVAALVRHLLDEADGVPVGSSEAEE